VYRRPNLHFLNDFTVTLISNLVDQLGHESLLDLRVQDNMVLELTGLHLFDRLQLDLGHVIFIHVQQNVLYHDDTQFLIGPQLIESLDEVVVGPLQNILGNWF
jgi:hypothetical protein